ncbi:squalene synthase HpnC [Labrys wisconsinensis]|uniref:Squalene synthase HpnC n=1 Tax=Labrys wisconsinensis TaxID=425677 RepID=A0ABU0JAD8_9HYPH|nr:squalene synthase HpnC [Labrys wisconsinensis]MDQ0470580.1 squalene synthase HpnC [Labrys wisconsinensis]
MDTASSARTGKGSGDENFPVASRLIAPRHRPAILAFYNFVRTADDVADHATLAPEEKLRLIDQLEAGLAGRSEAEPAARALRAVLQDRGLSPRHALDLLDAFRLDVRKARYASWDELIDYCRLSAMPVGRYVLDLHGESQALWPANDALCAALQVINHLQDCGKDFRALDRVYIPLDALSAAGADVAALGGDRASPALRRCLAALAQRAGRLLDEAQAFPAGIRDGRLSLEVAVIHRLARKLVGLIERRDPISERVHIGKAGALGVVAAVLAERVLRGPGRRAAEIGQPT